MAQSDSRTLRGIPRLLAMMLLLAATAGIAYWYGAREHVPKRTVLIDLAAGKLPPGIAPVVKPREGFDPQRDEEAWNHAVQVPLENGRAWLAWDEQALYGRVGGYDGPHIRPGVVWVSIRLKDRYVRLEYDWISKRFAKVPGEGFGLRIASITDYATGQVSLLPETAFESSADSPTIAQGRCYELRFRIPWVVVGVTSPGSDSVGVQVSRLVETPAGCSVEMGTGQAKQ